MLQINIIFQRKWASTSQALLRTHQRNIPLQEANYRFLRNESSADSAPDPSIIAEMTPTWLRRSMTTHFQISRQRITVKFPTLQDYSSAFRSFCQKMLVTMKLSVIGYALTSLYLWQPGLATIIVNRTIDDELGDSVTGLRPVYFPTENVWDDQTCDSSKCSHVPSVAQAVNGTYTAGTHRPTMGLMGISMQFTDGTIALTSANFTVDGEAPVFFTIEDSPYANHTLNITTKGPVTLYVNFDYAIYTGHYWGYSRWYSGVDPCHLPFGLLAANLGRGYRSGSTPPPLAGKPELQWRASFGNCGMTAWEAVEWFGNWVDDSVPGDNTNETLLAALEILYRRHLSTAATIQLQRIFAYGDEAAEFGIGGRTSVVACGPDLTVVFLVFMMNICSPWRWFSTSYPRCKWDSNVWGPIENFQSENRISFVILSLCLKTIFWHEYWSTSADDTHTMDFLWVHWFGHDTEYRSGFKACCLPRIRFFDGNEDRAFGFLDPNDIIRAAHLMPAFSQGCSREPLGRSISHNQKRRGGVAKILRWHDLVVEDDTEEQLEQVDEGAEEETMDGDDHESSEGSSCGGEEGDYGYEDEEDSRVDEEMDGEAEVVDKFPNDESDGSADS
ncbi:uncharacterized protein LACBIDRAFT_329829 [Laccaria bicolor S238N-H82]|uniref:Predicted protein n=1 Tax=Laccaria bicolor (strain S238N-H82 / ATCC MYA-4686) TaxID=486041 RepID=B0DJC6_LACBS|nr:uncharacterized protein LACBIDRAFT_329829 [Laccaria bicolor S238N-H82]EDR05496.1 predicted protein [Laccaria bicolor S238N-H82]|eukprot:XP_001884054.1 predicted protein [Laccaria bicolor S238N-H82]